MMYVRNTNLHKEKENVTERIDDGKVKSFIFSFLIDVTDNMFKIIIAIIYMAFIIY